MAHPFIIVALLLPLPAQSGGRAPSMLGGRPAPKADVAKADVAKPSPPAPAEREVPAEVSAQALAEYNGLKGKTPHTIAAQMKLAAWCEQHGLKAEAQLHYGEVIRLDPKREAAWKKLGFKKYGNQWMTDAQIAEAEEQKKSDRVWAPQIRKIHKDIHGANGAKKRDLARQALEAIQDEKAIPTLYRSLGGGQTDQILLIQALDRIDKPLATRYLATLAVYGKSPEVRRRATEVLRGRPARDYLGMLVGLLVDPIKYEVKPVAGPGSPGVLFVEGERFNVARFYSPPAPNVTPMPGDLITYDQFGMPVITRSLGISQSFITRPNHQFEGFQRDLMVQYSASQMMLEAETGAAKAESQLQGDVAQVKAANDARRHFNELVMSVASYASGKTLGVEPREWRKAVDAEKKYAKEPEPSKPTVSELVPLDYQPRYAQIGFLLKPIIDS